MNYRVIKEFPTYEINREGTVRRKDTQRKILTEREGSRYASLIDEQGRSKHRTIKRLLKDTFPEDRHQPMYMNKPDFRRRDNLEVEWRTIQSVPYLEINIHREVRTVETKRIISYYGNQVRFTLEGVRQSAPVEYLIEEAFPESIGR